MATKTVIAADYREWQVQRRIEWATPAVGDEFEHDVDAGSGAVVLILSSLAFFWLMLLVWVPDNVIFPWFYWLVVVVGLGFFPARWLLRRPFTITAKTQGGYDLPPESWTGMVRGLATAREETRVVVRSLKNRSTPGHADSPLQPMN
ncbi:MULTISPECIES: hypothetical protein [unclassified Pseudonocardia]|uniref:hypothetical protein n=1 Tax=unclassified Pseudonocardia TaxID=2619320 RepID=UPI0001FFDC17|nr:MULTISPECIES: hypothetical protein [unclassified Pseudonocardia]ALE75470.1 hypothetical protein FRP1_25955 [Pseudonocardia sp. EC080625-04]ALL74840.1 hypothetical protein AD006_05140 [Pseudonocardia sp. EC080610-09]ALL81863.1 hypothetical protein AD017_12960 [Pseudonocardia sp. EC080619-01]OLL75150.1 hypothetical protein Ae150APs1_3528 [Pseudonocardia sp. Ae150A_Ps1]OLL84741.1 hypothetical protein Ae263Ps1_1796c [Pseudonocardia sp. Ae263_Ps1]